MNTITDKGLKEIVDQAIDKIDDLINCNSLTLHACDLHHEIYNTTHFEIYTDRAEQWLEKHYPPFRAIGKVQEYEQYNFGEVNTDLSGPCSVLNMLVYILGEEILNESDHLSEVWDDQLTPTDLETIKQELLEAYEHLFGGDEP